MSYSLGANSAKVNTDDINATANALRVALPSGYPDFRTFLMDLEGFSADGHAHELNTWPVASAFADAWMSMHQQSSSGHLKTVAELLAQVPSGTFAPQGVFAGAWSQYMNAWRTFAPQLVALFAAYAPGDVLDPNLAARQAWNAAVNTEPTITTPGGLVVPQSAVVLGPTELPDGTVYLQYREPIGGTMPVVWWNGPNFKPVTTSPGNPVIKTANNDLVQLRDRGTGDWYRCMVVYQDDNACRPPLGYTGGYTLPAAIAASLGNQSGQAGAFVGPVAPAIAVAPYPDVNLQTDPRVDTSAANPTVPVPSATDPSGLMQPTSPQVPVQIYSALPSAQVAPGASSPPDAKAWVIAGVAAIMGTLVILSASKRGR